VLVRIRNESKCVSIHQLEQVRISEEMNVSEDTHVLLGAEGGSSQRTEKKSEPARGTHVLLTTKGRTSQDIICIWASERTHILLNALLVTSQDTER